MLTINSGNLSLLLDKPLTIPLEIPEQYIKNRFDRDGEHHHITLIRKNELPKDNSLNDILEDLKTRKYYNEIFNVGIGKVNKQNEEVYFQIIYWPIGNEIRRELNLPPKDFHVTLGFKNNDIHNVNKGYSTLIQKYINLELLDEAETFSMAFYSSEIVKYEFIKLLDVFINGEELDLRQLGLSYTTKTKLYYQMKDYENSLSNCMILKKYYPNDTINLARIAFIHVIEKKYYQAIHIYKTIMELTNNDFEKKMAEKKISMCYEKLKTVCSPREKHIAYIYDSNENTIPVEMSRNFSWVIPCKLAGMSIPKHENQIQAFEFMNIGLVVSVLEEERLPQKIFDGTNVKNIHYDVVNYRPPEMSDLLKIISEMENTIKEDKGVVVHCGGGKGRAGTILACYMLKNGLDGDLKDASEGAQMSGVEVIQKLRELRPGSIETVEQENFIKEYCNYLWKNSTI
jgi:atypical dual specificity phosphatase